MQKLFPFSGADIQTKLIKLSFIDYFRNIIRAEEIYEKNAPISIRSGKFWSRFRIYW